MLLDQLTRRQKQVFEFIRDKIDNRGYGPTVREIGDRFPPQVPQHPQRGGHARARQPRDHPDPLSGAAAGRARRRVGGHCLL